MMTENAAAVVILPPQERGAVQTLFNDKGSRDATDLPGAYVPKTPPAVPHGC